MLVESKLVLVTAPVESTEDPRASTILVFQQND